MPIKRSSSVVVRPARSYTRVILVSNGAIFLPRLFILNEIVPKSDPKRRPETEFEGI